jgi:hypothetical protein
MKRNEKSWSGRPDLNRGPLAPKFEIRLYREIDTFRSKPLLTRFCAMSLTNSQCQRNRAKRGSFRLVTSQAMSQNCTNIVQRGNIGKERQGGTESARPRVNVSEGGALYEV